MRGGGVLGTWAAVVALVLAAAPGALAAGTTITVTSTAGTLGSGVAGQCTLRDALVVADSASNPALTTAAEPGGSGASADCAGEVSGSGSPYTIELGHAQTYTLSAVDNYWFGPDGLPPISDTVTIAGNGSTITRSSAPATPDFRFFYVSGGLSGIPAGNLTLQDLELSGGVAQGGASQEGGGGAGMGGAIFDQGALSLERATLDSNSAAGGALAAGFAYGGAGIGASASASTDDGTGFGGAAPGANGGAGAPGSLTSTAGGGGGGFRSSDPGSGANGGGAGGFGGAGGSTVGNDGGGPAGAGGDGGGSGGVIGGTTGSCAGGDFGAGGEDGSPCAPAVGGGGGGVGGGGARSAGGGGGGGFGGGGGPGGLTGGDGGFGGGGGAVGGTAGFGGGTPLNDGQNEGGGGAGMGGAVFSLFGQVTIDDSTLANNAATGGTIDTSGDGLGGAIFNVDGSVSLSFSTIASNTASGGSPAGGGIYNLGYGNTIASGGPTAATVSVANSIVYGNTGVSGGEDDLSENDVNGSHDNLSSADLGGTGTNFVSGLHTAGGAIFLGNSRAANPDLGSLELNGGSLKTMKPAANSPVLGIVQACDATDELGTPRPTTGCDSGAYEETPALIPTVSTSPATDVTASAATLNGSVNPRSDQTTYQFELSTASSFSTFTSLPSSAGDAGQGKTPVAESVSATGLSAGTTYYYRLVATDNAGTATSTPATEFATPPAGRPANTASPAITGRLKAGDTLTCSPGTWSNAPGSYTYQWDREGTPIAGATGSTYKIVSLDEGEKLTCTVTAKNSLGAGSPVTSAGVSVPVPHVAKCPAASGRLHGTILGLLRLGDTHKQAEHAYRHSSSRGKHYEEFFCLTPQGVRVGYASPKLLKTLPARERGKLAGRVIWISTSSAYYNVNGVRPGATVSAASKKLKLSKVFVIGKNDWYLAPAGSATAVLKVRQGVVEEIGIGERNLTDGSRGAQRAFLTSFE
jgi:hypothetical protein